MNSTQIAAVFFITMTIIFSQNQRNIISYIVGSRKGYEAGQQSKQAEVDDLKKRIDDLKSFCIKGVESNMLSIEYNQALIDMHKILKGNTSEH